MNFILGLFCGIAYGLFLVGTARLCGFNRLDED